MTNMPRLVQKESRPRELGGDPEPTFDSAAVAQMMAMLEDICRYQKQQAAKLATVEHTLRNIRRRGAGHRPRDREG